MTPLLTALQNCAQRSQSPFYTPGHKRGQGIPPELAAIFGAHVFRADLPELPELDNLFAPDGVIRAAQNLAAEAFGAEQTWFLVNGSTSGVMAALLATCHPGDKVILPRNSHQSAISGLILSGAMPVFVNPDYDPLLDIAHSITPEGVAIALAQHPDIKAVLMVSPTYYGACGNVAAIAELCHAQGIPLIVDEAHGAHFAFHPDLPTPALVAGADLAVQSIHKTLSAFTQSAMLHSQGERVDRDRLSQCLQLVQSTSPSYLLLASLDAARQQMATQGTALMERTLHLAATARSQTSAIPGLTVLCPTQATTPGFAALDPTRLTVTVANLGMTGFTADQFLSDHWSVIAELPTLHNLTFIITFGNTPTDIEQLIAGFAALSKTTGNHHGHPSSLPPLASHPLALPSLSPRDAFFAPRETVPIAQAVNRVSVELICPYPPGIPVLLPGETVTPEAIADLQNILSAGGFLSGCADPSLGTLQVVK